MARQKDLTDTTSFKDILELIAALRAESGCPWDRKQTPHTMTAYLIEEMYELVDAIESDDTEAICDELGDVVFQVLFVLYLYQSTGRVTLEEVLGRNRSKMIRRHPHVFGEEKVDNTDQVKTNWRRIKKEEKGSKIDSLLSSVPTGMPALMRAYRLSERAAGIGFDWNNLPSVIAQAESEWTEFKQEVDDRHSRTEAGTGQMAMEFGDVLFTLVNVARKAKIHPEKALIQSIRKFVRRFQRMEAAAADQNAELEALSQEEMERLWKIAKASEK